MDMTTVARAKVLIEADGQRLSVADDTTTDLLSRLIEMYSAEAEASLSRLVSAEARTAQFHVEPQQHVFALPAYPVTAIASVRHDTGREFASSSEIDDTAYYADDNGLLHVDGQTLAAGRGALRVTWTGGMAASVASFATAFPDLAGAIDMQVTYHWQRRSGYGSQGESVGAGNVSYSGPLKWLAHVERVFARHRRLGIG